METDGVNDLPGLDIAQGVDRLGGDAQRYYQIVESFLERFVDTPEEVRRLLQRGSMEEVIRRVHAVKGVSGNLTMDRLHRQASAVLADLRAGNSAVDLGPFLESLEEVLESLRRLLDSPVVDDQHSTEKIAETASRSQIILVVDDQPINLEVARSVLDSDPKLRVVTVESGEVALEYLLGDHPPPLLVLLNVQMSGINGYQVVERMKRDPDLCDIPVIFLSAQSETVDLVEGFRHGGVDYVIQPFVPEILLARVKTHIRLRLLELQRESMREMEREAERSERDAAYRNGLVEMGGTILHNIGNLLVGVQGVLYSMEESGEELNSVVVLLRQLSERLKQGESPETVAGFLQELAELLEGRLLEEMQQDRTHAFQVFTAIRDLVFAQRRITQDGLVYTRFKLQDLLDDVVVVAGEMLRERSIQVVQELDPMLPDIRLPRSSLGQVIHRLLENSSAAIAVAIQSGQLERSQGQITLRATRVDEGGWSLEVEDNGLGVDPERLDSLIQVQRRNQEDSIRQGLHDVANFICESGGRFEIDSIWGVSGMRAIMRFHKEVKR